MAQGRSSSPMSKEMVRMQAVSKLVEGDRHCWGARRALLNPTSTQALDKNVVSYAKIRVIFDKEVSDRRGSPARCGHGLPMVTMLLIPHLGTLYTVLSVWAWSTSIWVDKSTAMQTEIGLNAKISSVNKITFNIDTARHLANYGLRIKAKGVREDVLGNGTPISPMFHACPPYRISLPADTQVMPTGASNVKGIRDHDEARVRRHMTSRIRPEAPPPVSIGCLVHPALISFSEALDQRGLDEDGCKDARTSYKKGRTVAIEPSAYFAICTLLHPLDGPDVPSVEFNFIENDSGDTNEEEDMIMAKMRREIEPLQSHLLDLQRKCLSLPNSARIASSCHQLRYGIQLIADLFYQNASDGTTVPVWEETYEAPRVRMFHTKGIDFDRKELGDLPTYLDLLRKDISNFVECIRELPPYNHETVTTSFSLFQRDLKYLTSCLRSYKGSYGRETLNDRWNQFCQHLNNITIAMEQFKDLDLDTIKSAQAEATMSLANLVTIGMFQYTFVMATPAIEATEGLWFSSLALSTGAAVNCILGLIWRQAMYSIPGTHTPVLLLLWIKHSPLIFLGLSVVCFSVGLVVFAYCLEQSLVVCAVTTVVTLCTTLGLSLFAVWFALERLAFYLSGGKKTLSEVILVIRKKVVMITGLFWMTERCWYAMSWGVRRGRMMLRRTEAIHRAILSGLKALTEQVKVCDVEEKRDLESATLHQTTVTPSPPSSSSAKQPKMDSKKEQLVAPFPGATCAHGSWNQESSMGLVHHIHFSPHGSYLLVWRDSNAMLYNNNLEVIRFRENISPVWKICEALDNVLQDDRLLILAVLDSSPDESESRPTWFAPERQLIVYNMLNEEIESRVSLQSGAQAISLSRCQQHVIVDYPTEKGLTQLWSIEKYRLQLQRTLTAEQFPAFVAPASFAGVQDQWVIRPAKDGIVYIWDNTSDSPTIIACDSHLHITHLAWNATTDDTFAVADERGNISVWKLIERSPSKHKPERATIKARDYAGESSNGVTVKIEEKEKDDNDLSLGWEEGPTLISRELSHESGRTDSMDGKRSNTLGITGSPLKAGRTRTRAKKNEEGQSDRVKMKAEEEDEPDLSGSWDEEPILEEHHHEPEWERTNSTGSGPAWIGVVPSQGSTDSADAFT
ncbi:hypothetical protein NEOLEDRAFT_1148835 [Neolentinus lepideus HHB14362 ss-1]|uniref:WD40 repeat-like protein n=1 Tax=Neolentinus lepideus HHB14362 ss-1 TaxID=1314782 RepID=A0A165RST1_9AGAM|nr:hypothetical protein NEOLEDRAFT_1148835 [Neolentinus lepideus HHB14362 ss-1]